MGCRGAIKTGWGVGRSVRAKVLDIFFYVFYFIESNSILTYSSSIGIIFNVGYT